MWVTKLLISPVKVRIFCPRTTEFGLKLAFLFISGQALPAHLVPCWWVGLWLWRAGCISQDTYLLYLTKHPPMVKNILIKEKEKQKLKRKRNDRKQQKTKAKKQKAAPYREEQRLPCPPSSNQLTHSALRNSQSCLQFKYIVFVLIGLRDLQSCLQLTSPEIGPSRCARNTL